MTPDPKHVGRAVRISWPGQPEHNHIGTIITAKQVCYDVLIGSCLVLTLEPSMLTPVYFRGEWHEVAW